MSLLTEPEGKVRVKDDLDKVDTSRLRKKNSKVNSSKATPAPAQTTTIRSNHLQPSLRGLHSPSRRLINLEGITLESDAPLSRPPITPQSSVLILRFRIQSYSNH